MPKPRATTTLARRNISKLGSLPQMCAITSEFRPCYKSHSSNGELNVDQGYLVSVDHLITASKIFLIVTMNGCHT